MKFISPYRVCFTGGSLDIFPINQMLEGVTVNATIDRYVVVDREPSPSLKIEADVEDTALLEKIAKIYRIKQGKYTIENELPINSGMGGSASAAMALMWAFGEMNRSRAVSNSYNTETQLLRICGGNQDQFAAAFGGFQIIKGWKNTQVTPSQEFRRYVLNKLEFRLRRTGVSGKTNSEIVNGFLNGNNRIMNLLKGVKKQSDIAALALAKDDHRIFVKAVKKERKFREKLSPRNGDKLNNFKFEDMGVRKENE